MLRRAQRDKALGILVDLPIAHPLAPLEKQAREKGWYSLAAPLNTGEVGEPVDRRRTLFCATAQPLGKISLRDLGFHGIMGAPARPFLLPTAEVPPSCWASEGRWGGDTRARDPRGERGATGPRIAGHLWVGRDRLTVYSPGAPLPAQALRDGQPHRAVLIRDSKGPPPGYAPSGFQRFGLYMGGPDKRGSKGPH